MNVSSNVVDNCVKDGSSNVVDNYVKGGRANFFRILGTGTSIYYLEFFKHSKIISKKYPKTDMILGELAYVSDFVAQLFFFPNFGLVNFRKFEDGNDTKWEIQLWKMVSLGQRTDEKLALVINFFVLVLYFLSIVIEYELAVR